VVWPSVVLTLRYSAARVRLAVISAPDCRADGRRATLRRIQVFTAWVGCSAGGGGKQRVHEAGCRGVFCIGLILALWVADRALDRSQP
jgi:hypothetical protein